MSEGDERSNFTMNFFVQQFVNDSMFFCVRMLKRPGFCECLDWVDCKVN